MALVKGTIGLAIRERHPETERSMYSQDATRRWLDELPTANLGETSKRVYHRLLESNSLLMGARTRSNLLESLSPSVQHICDSLKRHYMGQNISLSAKQKKIVNLCQAIQLEIAIGYKTIIEDLLCDEKYDSKLLPNAISNCLFYFHAVQIRSYQLYTDLPSGLWHEIHILYQLAEQNQFHDKSTSINNKSYSTLGLYKKLVLLATTNPNQLRQRDIEDISNHLLTLAKKAQIDSAPDVEYDFVVNLNSDAPPFHRALIKDGMKAHYRGINVHRVVELIQDELKNEKPKIGIDSTTLRHLLRAWGTMATRAFARSKGSGDIQVSIGLAGCHYLINKEIQDDDIPVENLEGGSLIESLEGSLKDAMIIGEDDEHFFTTPQASHLNWNSSASGPSMKTDNFWDAVYVKKANNQLTEEKEKAIQFMSRTRPEKAKYDFQEATIINISPGGYCLKLDGILPKQTQTGEIIGLLELNNDGSHIWNIGTIRWLHHETGCLQLGVQLIAPNAEPVLGQMRSSHMEEHSYQRCLLLPELTGIGQPPTILTSPMPFAANHNIHIKSSSIDEVIHLEKQLSYGHSYQQFTYRNLHVDKTVSKSSTNSVDFDSLWDVI